MPKAKVIDDRRELPSGALLTHAEIAELFGVTRSCIFQQEQRALYKLRRAIEREAQARGCDVIEWLLGF